MCLGRHAHQSHLPACAIRAIAREDLKKLPEIARVHIARCEAGDMQAIKELADRLDGRPAQILEHSGADSETIGRIGRVSAAEDEPVLIDWRELRDGDGSGGRNEYNARTKR